MSVLVEASGVRDLAMYFDRFPDITREAMSLAINDTARGTALTAARRDITAQVAFPDGYLDRPDRLSVTKFATPTRLEAKISGRDRPTSLARFAVPGTPITVGAGRTKVIGKGVTIQIKPGVTKFFANGFLWQFPGGNIGFALRLRPGETVKGVHTYPVYQVRDKMGRPTGLFILYAPSVDQVFQSVAEEIGPEVTSELADEFMRQFTRLSGADQ